MHTYLGFHQKISAFFAFLIIVQDSGYLTVLKEDVEQDDADLVRHTDVGVQ